MDKDPAVTPERTRLAASLCERLLQDWGFNPKAVLEAIAKLSKSSLLKDVHLTSEPRSSLPPHIAATYEGTTPGTPREFFSILSGITPYKEEKGCIGVYRAYVKGTGQDDRRDADIADIAIRVSGIPDECYSDTRTTIEDLENARLA